MSLRYTAWLKIIGLAVLVLSSCACVCCWFDPRTQLIDESNPNPQVELLKSYIPESTLSDINPEYFTYFGFRDWWRFPLVYPYSIHTIDEVDFGWLYDESQVESYRDINSQKLVDTGIHGITHLAIDKHYLLLRTEDRAPFAEEAPTPIELIIFDFDTAERIVFGSEEEMLQRAEDLGFDGDLRLLTLREYDALFWE